MLERRSGTAVDGGQRSTRRSVAQSFQVSTLSHLGFECDDTAGIGWERFRQLPDEHQTSLAVVLHDEAAGFIRCRTIIDILQTGSQVVDDADVMNRIGAEVVVVQRELDDIARQRGVLVGEFDDPQFARFVRLLVVDTDNRRSVGFL